ncbi:MAG: response regulator [Candidatus Obscuribacterales bacterium]|nr:response regulator [Candidatus Obscuribacterales bacterium]
MTNILVIEDDAEFASTLAEFLEEEPDLKIIHKAGTEEEAQEFFRSGRLNEIDCVLLDLKLPKHKGDRDASTRVGLGILEHLRVQEKFFRTVLIVTSSQLQEDGERAMSGGCDGYLCKHAAPDEIMNLVDELKLAMRGDILVVPRQMRYVFLREGLSAKEAKLMELLDKGLTWAQVAVELSYRNASVAATVGYRVFDKLLSIQEQEENSDESKRAKALERWRARSKPRPREAVE